MKIKSVALAADHGGFAMKVFLKSKLEAAGYNVIDFGTNSDDSVDYPDVIHPVASKVNDGSIEMAIIMCGSGNGAQMTANKYPNVRAGLCWNEEQATLTRMHNNANILSLPGRFVPFDQSWEMVKLFLTTDYEGGRHDQRVQKISKCI